MELPPLSPGPGLSGTLSELLQAIDGFADFMSLDLPPGAGGGGDAGGDEGGEVQSRWQPSLEPDGPQPEGPAAGDLLVAGSPTPAGLPSLDALCMALIQQHQQEQQQQQAAAAAGTGAGPAAALAPMTHMPLDAAYAGAAVHGGGAATAVGPAAAPAAHPAAWPPGGLLPPLPVASVTAPSAHPASQAGSLTSSHVATAASWQPPSWAATAGTIQVQTQCGGTWGPTPPLPGVVAPAAAPAAAAAAAADPAPKLSKQQRRDLAKATQFQALERQLEEQQERLRQLTLQNRALVLRERVLQEVARCRGELEAGVRGMLVLAELYGAASSISSGQGVDLVVGALAGKMHEAGGQQTGAQQHGGSAHSAPGGPGQHGSYGGGAVVSPSSQDTGVAGRGGSGSGSTAGGGRVPGTCPSASVPASPPGDATGTAMAASLAPASSASPADSAASFAAIIPPGTSPFGPPNLSAMRAGVRQWITGLAQILVDAPPGSPEVEARLRAYIEPMAPMMMTGNLLNPLVYELHVEPIDESLPKGPAPESHWRAVTAVTMPAVSEAQGELRLAIYDVFKSWHARVLQHRQAVAADLAAATAAAGAGGGDWGLPVQQGAAPEVVAVAARLERNVRQQRLLMVLLEWHFMCPGPDCGSSYEQIARNVVACYPWPPDAMALLHAFKQMWPQHLQERRRRQTVAVAAG